MLTLVYITCKIKAVKCNLRKSIPPRPTAIALLVLFKFNLGLLISIAVDKLCH